MSAKTDWDKIAKAIPISEWENRIRALLGRREQIKAASIVWWDYLSTGKLGKSPFMYDLYCQWDADSDLSPEASAKVLQAIGYPADVARARAGGDDAEDAEVAVESPEKQMANVA